MEDCCAVKGNGKGSYDLAVIGAGSAGFSAAIAAVDQGAQVALIGHGMIGGTCVNTGCVPSKTMIRAAETLHQAKTASRFRGIEVHAKVADWRAVMADKKALVERLRHAKYVDLLPAYNSIAYLEGRARLVDGGASINGESVKAGKVIVATGSSPSLPPIDGHDRGRLEACCTDLRQGYCQAVVLRGIVSRSGGVDAGPERIKLVAFAWIICGKQAEAITISLESAQWSNTLTWPVSALVAEMNTFSSSQDRTSSKSTTSSRISLNGLSFEGLSS